MLAMTSGAEEKKVLTEGLSPCESVSNVITGEIVYIGEIKDYNGTLDTSQWKSGIFAVKSRIGDSVIVQKIAVK